MDIFQNHYKGLIEMKIHYIMLAALLLGLLSGCAQNNQSQPTLGGFSEPTGRLPSPGNTRGTAANEATRMAPPIMTY